MLKNAQVQALQNPNQVTFQAERDLHQKWNFLREIEELFYKQKSRITWLREGDLNTTYFFRICLTRASYNAIRAFMKSDGTWILDPMEMSDHTVNHFASVLREYSYRLLTQPVWFQELTDYSFPQHLSQQMLLTPTAEEIKATLFKLNPNKAPGPDGLTSAFFKASWDTTGGRLSQQCEIYLLATSSHLQ